MYQLLEWTDQLDTSSWTKDQEEQSIFLEPHPDYPNHYLVNSYDRDYREKLDGYIHPEYLTINEFKLESLFEKVAKEGYQNVYLKGNTQALLDTLNSLDVPYPYPLNVTLKQFQLRGFNYTKDLDSVLINWSTGTGKSVYAVARAKYLLRRNKVDRVVVLSKSHNKINWQRTFWKMGELHAEVDDAWSSQRSTSVLKRNQRLKMYNESQIFIINYEKLRYIQGGAGGDGQELEWALENERVLWIWDEMPSKMKNTTVSWFRGAQKILKTTESNCHVALTATKIETNPENIYSCMKILDPSIWSTKQSFRSSYAKSMSTFSPWQVATWDKKKLHELGMKISYMTHVADKYREPDIREQFPKEHSEDVIIDMSTQDRMIYESALKEGGTGNDEIFSKLVVLQLLCNNPQNLIHSTANLAKILRDKHLCTDRNCAKLDTLKEMLNEISGKVVVFSAMNEYGSKMLVPYLTKWNIPFVLYDGSAKKKQEAEDTFRNNRNIKVFLSSDLGSDSINLERASTVINYDLPWNYATLLQRVNRISRITSEADHIYFYNLVMANTMEEKKLKLLERKKQFEIAIDKGLEGQELAIGSTFDDMRWLLT